VEVILEQDRRYRRLYGAAKAYEEKIGYAPTPDAGFAG